MSAPAIQEINPCVAAMRPSATLAVSARAKALKRAGRPVIELSAGEPDFPTPEPIRRAGIEAIEEGFTCYTPNPGMPELREAIVARLEADYGLRYGPGQVICSNGAKQSVAQALMVLLRPGDEVLIPAPYWVSYPEMVRLAGGRPVAIETTPGSGYRLTPDQLDRAITGRTRVLILNSPSNPTGAVYTREEMEALAVVLRRYEHVIVISDEIYAQVLYEGEHVAVASLEGLFDRVLTINGFSKAYAMTGWRLGYLAGPDWVVRAVDKLQGQLTSAPSSISQRAGIAALEMDGEPVRQMVRAFRERRDFVLEALENIHGVVCPRPGGAFYVFADVSAYFDSEAPDRTVIGDASELCLHLLDTYDVALVPGDAFGAPYGVRLSYAASPEDLHEALRRIADGLRSLIRSR
jgi:aspartate aminotransferase